MKLLVDISDMYGYPAYLSVYGIVYKDADIELADANDKDLKQWERTELLEAKETNIIPLLKIRGNRYLECDEVNINIEKLLLLYFFPGTKPPTDSFWDGKFWLSDATGIKGLEWKIDDDPLMFKNGAVCRADSKSSLKYISKEGKYYRLRIKKLKYSCLYLKLEDALKKRAELLETA